MPTRRAFLGGLASSSLFACRRDMATAVPRASDGSPDFVALREQFVYPRDIAYLNTGTLGAMPKPVLDAFVNSTIALEENITKYDYLADPEPPLTGYAKFEDVLAAVAQFVGAAPDEIALTQNATVGMNFAAHGIALAKGDEIVLSNQEHPGGIGPWKLQAERRGVIVKEIDLLPIKNDEEKIVAAFAAAMGPRTRVVMACHLTSLLGIRLPVARLCKLARERGAISVVDGAQTVGQMPIDLHALGCDIYVASPHKWLCAPKGTGFMYVRRGVPIVATLGSAEFANLEWGATRLQQFGTGSVANLHGLVAAIDFQNAIGIGAIETRDRELTARLRTGLAGIERVRIHSPTKPALHAAVTTFALDGVDPKELQARAFAAKVRIRSVHDDYGCRVGTHYYVQPAEIDRLLEVIATSAKTA
ncbi:MAG TPA: aminotransferase class V-fold PLP-dependent enzyme [Nannocystaceae bacterium]|nr:aminotransferase class V-fold PLP-dependent enzyme [Nannocystaceae bacterium]